MSDSTTPFRATTYTDAVGRRRKLSAGAMAAIREEFARGESTRLLAGSYGVSPALILAVCYNTPRDSDLARLRAEES